MQTVTAGISRLALIFLSAVVCFAQMPYGSIVGRVVDKEQGRIPGAGVKAVNLSTQVVTTTRSNTEGNYIVPNLVPGTYRVEIEKDGFKRFTREPIEVQIGRAHV